MSTNDDSYDDYDNDDDDGGVMAGVIELLYNCNGSSQLLFALYEHEVCHRLMRQCGEGEGDE